MSVPLPLIGSRDWAATPCFASEAGGLHAAAKEDCAEYFIERDETTHRPASVAGTEPAWSSLAGLPAIFRILLALSPGARDGPRIARRADTNSVLAERAQSTSRWARDRPVSPDPETLLRPSQDFAIASLRKTPFSLDTTLYTCSYNHGHADPNETLPAAQARPRLDPRPVCPRPRARPRRTDRAGPRRTDQEGRLHSLCGSAFGPRQEHLPSRGRSLGGPAGA